LKSKIIYESRHGIKHSSAKGTVILLKHRHSLQHTAAKGSAFAEQIKAWLFYQNAGTACSTQLLKAQPLQRQQIVFAFEIPTLHRTELGNRIGQVKMQHQFGP
jgi:hypothetical protein